MLAYTHTHIHTHAETLYTIYHILYILLQDNPAVYSFFFDTSRKRTCYIAPERFIDEQATKNYALDVYRADIFSLGYSLAVS